MKLSAIICISLALAAVPAALVSAHSPNCAATPAPHVYGLGGSTNGHVRTVTAADDLAAGVFWVTDTNGLDCNADGIPGDFDGDYETGNYGAFFGAGPWANEATCAYGLRTHGTAVTVTDILSANIAFVTGADDQSGPIVVPDPVNGGFICETDGSVTPGDPATDPTADADDCLSTVFVNTGSACGFGGDGGYWVFLAGGVTGFITA